MGSHDDARIQHIYHAELSSFCGLTPDHIAAVVSSRNGLKNSVTGGTGLLHSQPFTNINSHFLLNMKFAQMGQIHQCAWTF